MNDKISFHLFKSSFMKHVIMSYKTLFNKTWSKINIIELNDKCIFDFVLLAYII